MFVCELCLHPVLEAESDQGTLDLSSKSTEPTRILSNIDVIGGIPLENHRSKGLGIVIDNEGSDSLGCRDKLIGKIPF